MIIFQYLLQKWYKVFIILLQGYNDFCNLFFIENIKGELRCLKKQLKT